MAGTLTGKDFVRLLSKTTLMKIRANFHRNLTHWNFWNLYVKVINWSVRLTEYCAGGKIEKNEMGGACSTYGEGRGVYRVLVGRPEGKRPLGRPRRRWEDNIKMDLQEVGGGFEDWMELAQDRDRWRALVGTVMNLGVPKMRGISWLAAEPVSFSRRTLLHGVSK